MEGGADTQAGHELHVQLVDDKIKEYPLKDRLKLIALNNLQQEKQKLDEELDEKIRLLHKENDIASLPIQADVRQIIEGTRPLSEEELQNLQDFFTQEDIQVLDKNIQEPIDNYWGQALFNCNALGHVWGDKDKEILKFLTAVELEMSNDTEVFTLKFQFKDNEYFKNKELYKKFILEAGEEFPKKTEGTEIEWIEGKDVTTKLVEKKQKNKKTGATRVVKKKEQVLSFFNFFKTTKDNDDDDDIEQDYEIGKTIAEEVIPYSLEYYLGINPEDDDFEDCDEEDDDEDDDEKDQDTSEDDKKDKKNRKKSGADEEEEKKKKPRKKSGDEGKGGAKQQECKQQ